MAFVKLDAAILTSSLWIDRGQRDLFITALLMALPFGSEKPMQTYRVRSVERDEFIVPPGSYGFVKAAGVAIIRMALMGEEEGFAALEALAAPDAHSRSTAFEGRRMVRVDGGFVILNFMKYREKDQTAAERMRKYRDRITRDSYAVTSNGDGATRNVTQAEAEAEAEAEERKYTRSAKPRSRAIEPDHEFLRAWETYPKRAGDNPKASALTAWNARRREGVTAADLLAGVERYRRYCEATDRIGTEFVMQARRFFGKQRPYAHQWEAPNRKGDTKSPKSWHQRGV
jgi:hypothetical protein